MCNYSPDNENGKIGADDTGVINCMPDSFFLFELVKNVLTFVMSVDEYASINFNVLDGI